jgi:hypothetical protein
MHLDFNIVFIVQCAPCKKIAQLQAYNKPGTVQGKVIQRGIPRQLLGARVLSSVQDSVVETGTWIVDKGGGERHVQVPEKWPCGSE